MILTLNDGKLVVNVPVSKGAGFWFTNERNRILGSVDHRYACPIGKIREYSLSKRTAIWKNISGQVFNSYRKYNFHNNMCYALSKEAPFIHKYSLLQPNITNFLLNGNEVNEIIELGGLLDKDAPSKPYEEINFILTCGDDEVKRILLYDRYPEFATMYFEFMPNIELKSLEEYPLSILKRDSRNEYKIKTAKNNNKVLQLLRK